MPLHYFWRNLRHWMSSSVALCNNALFVCKWGWRNLKFTLNIAITACVLAYSYEIIKLLVLVDLMFRHSDAYCFKVFQRFSRFVTALCRVVSRFSLLFHAVSSCFKVCLGVLLLFRGVVRCLTALFHAVSRCFIAPFQGVSMCFTGSMYVTVFQCCLLLCFILFRGVSICFKVFHWSVSRRFKFSLLCFVVFQEFSLFWFMLFQGVSRRVIAQFHPVQWPWNKYSWNSALTHCATKLERRNKTQSDRTFGRVASLTKISSRPVRNLPFGIVSRCFTSYCVTLVCKAL